MFIRSQHLFLRPVWAEDWADLLAGAGDEAVARNLAAVPWSYGEREARAFAAVPQDPRFPHFLITHLDGNGAARAVGCIALNAGARADGLRETALGFWIARAHWGKGYATEAARALLALAPLLGHRRVIASTYRDNPACARVLRKLGFYATGEVSERTSPARGTSALAVTFAIDLVADGGDDLSKSERMRKPVSAQVSLRAA